MTGAPILLRSKELLLRQIELLLREQPLLPPLHQLPELSESGPGGGGGAEDDEDDDDDDDEYGATPGMLAAPMLLPPVFR